MADSKPSNSILQPERHKKADNAWEQASRLFGSHTSSMQELFAYGKDRDNCSYLVVENKHTRVDRVCQVAWLNGHCTTKEILSRVLDKVCACDLSVLRTQA